MATRPTADAYRAALAAYTEAVVGLDLGGLDLGGLEPNALSSVATNERLEHQLECFRDWNLHHSLDEQVSWFEAQRANCAMTVEDIALDAVEGWSRDPATGNIAHSSGDFFVVHGVRVRQSVGREVGGGGWDQPILTQVGYDGGLLGLLRQRFDGVPHYLVEAKAEPGNVDLVQLSPTLQATFANLRRAHRGRRPLFAEVFEEPDRFGGTVLYRAWLSEDGGRLHKKRNLAMLVEVPEGTIGKLPPTFRWFSMFQLKALLLRDAWVNPHVRGIIAHR